MKTIRIKNEQNIQQIEHTVLVLGYFDGLHKGHQALFAEARKIAAAKDLKIAVLTFPESPKLAFVRYQPSLMLHLTSPEERLQQLENLGVDYLYLVDFTSQFARNTAEQFFTKYISRLKAKTVIAGFDYHFGSDRRSAEDLEKLFEGQVIIVPSVNFNGVKISSTRIRETVLAGNVAESNQLLGYSLSTSGIVVHGNARGRTIGYPTANLAPLDRVILPADGVYVADVVIDGKRYRSMTSLGKNVTFGGTELRLEANIFDFEGDIYGKTIEVFWLDYIRDIIKFNNIDELCDQLKADKKIAENFKKA